MKLCLPQCLGGQACIGCGGQAGALVSQHAISLNEARCLVYAKAVKDYFNVNDSESLAFRKGDIIKVLEQRADGIWRGSIYHKEGVAKTGMFPSNNVVLIDSKDLGTGDSGFSSFHSVPQYTPSSPSAQHQQYGKCQVAFLNADECLSCSQTSSLSEYIPEHHHDRHQINNGEWLSAPTTLPTLGGVGCDMRDSSPAKDSPGHSNRNSAASSDSGRGCSTGHTDVKVHNCVHGHGSLQQNRLSSQSNESGVSSRQSYQSTSSSSHGSLDLIQEAGPTSTISVTQLFQAGVPNNEVLNAWLHDVHFEEYYPLFVQAGYDLPTISRMTPEDLTAVGITKPAHRKRLKAEIARLNIPDGIPDFRPTDLLEWLHLLGLGDYLDTLSGQGYDSIDYVTDITWEDLEEIGIRKLGHQKKIMLAIDRLKRIPSDVKHVLLVDGRAVPLELLEPPPPAPPITGRWSEEEMSTITSNVVYDSTLGGTRPRKSPSGDRINTTGGGNIGSSAGSAIHNSVEGNTGHGEEIRAVSLPQDSVGLAGAMPYHHSSSGSYLHPDVITTQGKQNRSTTSEDKRDRNGQQIMHQSFQGSSERALDNDIFSENSKSFDDGNSRTTNSVVNTVDRYKIQTERITKSDTEKNMREVNADSKTIGSNSHTQKLVIKNSNNSNGTLRVDTGESSYNIPQISPSRKSPKPSVKPKPSFSLSGARHGPLHVSAANELSVSGQPIPSFHGQTITSLPGQAITSLSGQPIPSSSGQTITSLSGQTITSLLGQTTTSLPGQTIASLSGHIITSVSGQTIPSPGGKGEKKIPPPPPIRTNSIRTEPFSDNAPDSPVKTPVNLSAITVSASVHSQPKGIIAPKQHPPPVMQKPQKPISPSLTNRLQMLHIEQSQSQYQHSLSSQGSQMPKSPRPVSHQMMLQMTGLHPNSPTPSLGTQQMPVFCMPHHVTTQQHIQPKSPNHAMSALAAMVTNVPKQQQQFSQHQPAHKAHIVPTSHATHKAHIVPTSQVTYKAHIVPTSQTAHKAHIMPSSQSSHKIHIMPSPQHSHKPHISPSHKAHIVTTSESIGTSLHPKGHAAMSPPQHIGPNSSSSPTHHRQPQAQAFASCVKSLSEKFGKSTHEDDQFPDNVSTDSDDFPPPPPPIAMDIITPKIHNYGIPSLKDKGKSEFGLHHQRDYSHKSRPNRTGNINVSLVSGVQPEQQKRNMNQTQNQGNHIQASIVMSTSTRTLPEPLASIHVRKQPSISSSISFSTGIDTEATPEPGPGNSISKTKRSESTTSFESTSSSSSLDSNTLPFANENVGTIKQRTVAIKPVAQAIELETEQIHGDPNPNMRNNDPLRTDNGYSNSSSLSASTQYSQNSNSYTNESSKMSTCSSELPPQHQTYQQQTYQQQTYQQQKCQQHQSKQPVTSDAVHPPVPRKKPALSLKVTRPLAELSSSSSPSSSFSPPTSAKISHNTEPTSCVRVSPEPTINTDQQQTSNVLSDIDNMLQGLTEELDAMLEEELAS